MDVDDVNMNEMEQDWICGVCSQICDSDYIFCPQCSEPKDGDDTKQEEEDQNII